MATKVEHPVKVEDEVAPSPYGTAADPYGRTNHAMTVDEVAAHAKREGTLRPDGRARATLFFDDVLARAADELRAHVEAAQHAEPVAP